MTRRAVEADKVALGERIKWYREKILGMSQEEFARQFQGRFSRGAVGNWERGEGAKASNLKVISRHFDIPFDWLAWGEGEAPARLSSPRTEEAGVSAGPSSVPPKTSTHRIGFIPEIELAGESGMSPEESYFLPGVNTPFRVSTEWFLPDHFMDAEAGSQPSLTVILRITGDSMAPNYSSGDRVIVNLRERSFIQDSVYAVFDGDSSPHVKRLQKVFNSSPTRIRIMCDNSLYEAEERSLSELKIVGRVCGIIARR